MREYVSKKNWCLIKGNSWHLKQTEKKQTYNLQKPVILVLSSLGVMSICEVLSRLKSLKDLQEVRAARVVRVVQVVQAVQAV